MHTPVLLEQVVIGLRVKRNGRYIDATVGEGGHIKKILENGGKVLGIDWDSEQIKNLSSTMQGDGLKLIAGNFAEIEQLARESNFFPVDGVLFDLGLSYEQLNRSGRGFSYRNLDESLDMRLNLNSKKKAKDLINTLSEDELYKIFAKNSEDINSRKIAQTISRIRIKKRFEKVRDLIDVLKNVLGQKDERTYARIFQALRIEVNKEFDNLKHGLKGAINLLKKDGRVAVITFHSLEDRIVKKFILDNKLRQISRIKGGQESFERSAILRIFSK